MIRSLGQRAVLPVAMAAGLLAGTGCDTPGWFDPGEMMRATWGWEAPEPLIVPIMNNLDPAGRDAPEQEYGSARNIRPEEDLVADTSDYVIGRNDLLSISISDLAGPGMEQVKTTRVSESGMVSLPLIGAVKAAGLTEAELERFITQTYKDKNIIANATVSVSVLEARQRTFSILGVVSRPGQYQIVQSDFRLLDALTLAGDVQVQGVDYVYIIRKIDTGKRDTPGTGTPGTGTGTGTGTPPGTGTKPVDPLKPKDPLKPGQVRAKGPIGPALAAGSTVRPMHLAETPGDTTGPRSVTLEGKTLPTKGTPEAGTGTATPATGTGTGAPATPPAGATATPVAETTPGGAAPAGTGGAFAGAGRSAVAERTYIIKVPLEALQKGEIDNYNVVIRPNDTIIVPSPKVGEYYMGGHVQRPGVYSLTGRQITLKQAIISAGMIDPLGWPERTEVIRRLGKDRELFIRVNLPKVFQGEQADVFLRPYDVVNVGTNALAPFLAAFRGAFRFTYGFGFIYDRNFYDEAYNNNN